MSGIAIKPIGTLAAVLSLIQGLLWSIFCILAILVYNCQILPTINTPSDVTFIDSFIGLYFTGSVCGTSDTSKHVVEGVTSPDDILIWMSVYLAFSVLWVITSITWLADLHREGRPLVSMYLWCGVTGLTLILDLTATVWFGTDLASVMKLVLPSTVLLPTLVKLPLLLSTALMMTMAARGFVMYLVNAGLLAVVAMIAFKNIKKKPASRPSRMSFVNPAMNTTWPEREHTTSKDSWGPRSAPLYPTYINPPMSPTYDDMPPRSQPPLYLQDPPKGRASPPEVPKYNIPDPDYSPVMSRAYPQPMLPLRPALKKTHPSHVGRTVF